MKQVVIVLLCGVAVAGRADEIAAWEIAEIELDDGTYDASCTLPASTTAQHVAIAELTLSLNVNESTTSGQYGFKIAGGSGETTLAGAIAAGHYMQFTMTADADYLLNLSSLEMKGQSSGNGCDDIAILSSAGGFTDDAAIAARSGISGITGGFDTDSDPAGFGAPIDLSGPEYSGVSTITFRIYGWNSSGGTRNILPALPQRLRPCRPRYDRIRYAAGLASLPALTRRRCTEGFFHALYARSSPPSLRGELPFSLWALAIFLQPERDFHKSIC